MSNDTACDAATSRRATKDAMLERVDAAMRLHHVVDPSRLARIDEMVTEVKTHLDAGDEDRAARTVRLCIDYIREGQPVKE